MKIIIEIHHLNPGIEEIETENFIKDVSNIVGVNTFRDNSNIRERDGGLSLAFEILGGIASTIQLIEFILKYSNQKKINIKVIENTRELEVNSKGNLEAERKKLENFLLEDKKDGKPD